MKNLPALLGLSVGAFALFSGAAFAADNAASVNSSNLNLQLAVKKGCSVYLDSGSSVISFGTFIALKDPIPKTGSFSLKCTAGYAANEKIPVSLDAGSVNSADAVSDRKLYLNGSAAEGQFMHFQVFQGENSSTVWGDGNNGTKPYEVSYSKDDPNARYPFTLRLNAQKLEGLTAGTYSNILTMTINWPGGGS